MKQIKHMLALAVVLGLVALGLSACSSFDQPRPDGTYYYDGY